MGKTFKAKLQRQKTKQRKKTRQRQKTKRMTGGNNNKNDMIGAAVLLGVAFTANPVVVGIGLGSTLAGYAVYKRGPQAASVVNKKINGG